jgi:hypothetical protein
VIKFFFSRSVRNGLIQRHGHAPLTAIKNILFLGVRANRNEYHYSLSGSDPRTMPVMTKLLGGFIIVQLRGTPVSSEEVERDCPFYFPNGQECDLDKAHQFCRHPESKAIVIVDFGQEDTIAFLEATRP